MALVYMLTSTSTTANVSRPLHTVAKSGLGNARGPGLSDPPVTYLLKF